MTPGDASHPLDNPFWASLVGSLAHCGHGNALARRFLPEYSTIAALSGITADHVAALEALVPEGDSVDLVGPYVPSLPPPWRPLYESRIAQWIRTSRLPLPSRDTEVVTLDDADVTDMLALVELARPGPFRSRTIALGHFVGVREAGRLVAMAGERAWVGEWRELSAVCTHPQASGRGLARALVARVVNRMLDAGQTPFLHVDSRNQRAIDLYRSLGFVERTQYRLLQARRGDPGRRVRGAPQPSAA